MNIWENAVVTNKGLALLSKLIDGNTLEITKAVAASGYVTPGLLQIQKEVTDPKLTLLIREVAYPEEGKCALTCYMGNEGVNEGYTVSQVGVYATDPDEGEILFFIAQSQSGTGTIVPSEEESAGYSAEWTFYFQYGQADGVNVYVDQANTVNLKQMNEYVSSYVATEILAATIPEIDAVTS